MQNTHTSLKFDWRWLIILASITILLGMYGFNEDAIATNTPLSQLDLLYRSIQLFTLETGTISSPIHFTLEIARWLAPLITFSAAIKGILSLVQDKSKSLLQLRKIQKHAIICGLGNKGFYLAKELLEKGFKVVVIDDNAENHHLSYIVNKGAISLIGNALDSELLQRAGIQTASFLFTTTNKDTNNIGIVHEANKLIILDKNKDNINLNCYAEVSDFGTKELFYNHSLFSESKKHFNAQVFNLYDRGARLLFETYAPDSFNAILKKDDPAASILIFGSSSFAKSLILYAAHSGHYANEKKLYITLISEQAKQDVSALSMSYPALDKVVDITTATFPVNILKEKNLQTIIDTKPNVIYICNTSDTDAITFARRLRYLMGENSIPMVACLLQQNMLIQLLIENSEMHNSGIHLFPLIDKTCNTRQIVDEQHDNAAKIIHKMYYDDQIALGETPESNSSLIPWENLSEDMKDSNRGQADHLSIKLRAIGLTLKDVLNMSEPLSFSPQQIRLLAKMEHQRWMADKLLDGWQATTGKKDPKQKLTPLLIDFDDLPEDEKDKDERAVSYHMQNLINKLKKS